MMLLTNSRIMVWSSSWVDESALTTFSCPQSYCSHSFCSSFLAVSSKQFLLIKSFLFSSIMHAFSLHSSPANCKYFLSCFTFSPKGLSALTTMMLPWAFWQYCLVMFSYFSCPAVSQNWMLTSVPAMSKRCAIKSMATDVVSARNCPFLNLWSKLVFPTARFPSMITLYSIKLMVGRYTYQNGWSSWAGRKMAREKIESFQGQKGDRLEIVRGDGGESKVWCREIQPTLGQTGGLQLFLFLYCFKEQAASFGGCLWLMQVQQVSPEVILLQVPRLGRVELAPAGSPSSPTPVHPPQLRTI